jgi:hypothetical protein
MPNKYLHKIYSHRKWYDLVKIWEIILGSITQFHLKNNKKQALTLTFFMWTFDKWTLQSLLHAIYKSYFIFPFCKYYINSYICAVYCLFTDRQYKRILKILFKKKKKRGELWLALSCPLIKLFSWPRTFLDPTNSNSSFRPESKHNFLKSHSSSSYLK